MRWGGPWPSGIPRMDGFIRGLLVGGLEHEFYFPGNIGLLIIPIDFHIFKGVAQPPTSLYRKMDDLR